MRTKTAPTRLALLSTLAFLVALPAVGQSLSAYITGNKTATSTPRYIGIPDPRNSPNRSEAVYPDNSILIRVRPSMSGRKSKRSVSERARSRPRVQSFRLLKQKAIRDRAQRRRSKDISLDSFVVIGKDIYGNKTFKIQVPNTTNVLVEDLFEKDPKKRPEPIRKVVKQHDIEFLVPDMSGTATIEMSQPEWDGDSYQLNTIAVIPIYEGKAKTATSTPRSKNGK